MGDGLAAQLLSYQANNPILDRLMKETGFDGDNVVSSLLDKLDTGKANGLATTLANARSVDNAPPAPKAPGKKDL